MNNLNLALSILKERENNEIYFEKYFKITERDNNNIIPFKINKSQLKLKKIIEKWEKGERRTLFVVILKARRQGFSTYVEADFFKRIMHEKNKTAMVISYNENSAKTINAMCNMFYQYLPANIKPLSRASRGNGVILENPKYDPNFDMSDTNDPGLQSEFLIETSNNVSAGRGYNINYLHISELGLWIGDPRITMTSLLQAIPNKNSIVIIESTANGYNYFKEVWDEANAYIDIDGKRKKKNDYIPLFIPWFEDEGSVMPYTLFRLTRHNDHQWGNELELKDRYDLTYEQLEWRRWCIINKCDGSLSTFHQEYPCVAKGQLISTNKGFKKIEDIEVGDITETGTVKYKIGKGVKQILKITTWSKREIRVTCDHLISTKNNGFTKACNLKNGDEIRLSVPIFSREYATIKYNDYPVKESRIKIDEKIGLFLGYFMGDGCFMKNLSGSITVEFACDKRDTNVCEEIETLCGHIIGEKPTNRITGKNNGCYNIRSNNNKWFDFMLNLTCIERKDDNRYTRKVSVPDFIKKSPMPVIREFISALFESDGCVYKYSNNIMLFSKHEEFLRDIQLLLLGFGIGSNIRVQNKINNEGREYIGRVLYISAEYAYIFKRDIGFRSERKISYCSKTPQATSRKSHSAEYDKIEAIEDDGTDEVYDLTLANDNPTFGVNGILVHNCSPEEAFIATGAPVFDNASVEGRKEKLRLHYKDKPPLRGMFEYRFNVDRTIDDNSINFVPDEQGIITIYKEPERGKPYFIGGDTAGEGSNSFAAHCVDNTNGMQVAVYHCQMNADLFAYQMYCLGVYYNMAMIAIEMNYDGTPIKRLQDLNYWNLYKRVIEDNIAETVQEKYGFRTTTITRPLIISNLVATVRESMESFNDVDTLLEMLEFAKDKNGIPHANPGKSDDLVMAAAITHYCRKQMWTDVETSPEKRVDKDAWQQEYEDRKDPTGSWFE